MVCTRLCGHSMAAPVRFTNVSLWHMTRADGEHDVYTGSKSKLFAFVTRPRRPSVTILSCVWCMNIVYGSASVLVVCYCFKCGVLCTVCVCVSRLSLIHVLKGRQCMCYCADTLLNGVYAAVWSLHGCSCAIHERIVDL